MKISTLPRTDLQVKLSNLDYWAVIFISTDPLLASFSSRSGHIVKIGSYLIVGMVMAVLNP